MQFFGLIRNGKEGVRAGEVHFALLTAFVCLQLTELNFRQYSPALETIEKIPGTDYVSDRHRRFVEAAKAHFKGMAEDSSSCL
jgi:hypothetical protein